MKPDLYADDLYNDQQALRNLQPISPERGDAPHHPSRGRRGMPAAWRRKRALSGAESESAPGGPTALGPPAPSRGGGGGGGGAGPRRGYPSRAGSRGRFAEAPGRPGCPVEAVEGKPGPGRDRPAQPSCGGQPPGPAAAGSRPPARCAGRPAAGASLAPESGSESHLLPTAAQFSWESAAGGACSGG